MTNTLTKPKEVRLTQFSHGAGCGCKISPAILDKIIGNRKRSRNLQTYWLATVLKMMQP